MSLEPDSDGPLFQRIVDRAERPAPAWPLLAQLPRVGSAPTFAPQAPTYDHAPLGIVDPAEDGAAGRQRYVVDQPHRTAPPVREVSERVPAQYEPFAVHSSSTSRQTRHYRVDSAAGHRPPGRMIQTPREVATISGSIFRLHAALAPHMGMVGAAALVVSASLLYWMAFGRVGAVLNPNINFGNGLSQEVVSPGEPETSPAAAASVSALDAPSLDWAAPPHVANAAAGSTGESERTEATQNPQPNAGDGPSLSPADASAAPSEAATTTSVDDPITPTPQGEEYPTTPFPAFSFVAQPPVVDSSSASVAERASSSATPNTTR